MIPVRAAGVVFVTAWLLAAVTACSVTTPDAGYVPPAPLPPMEQLAQAPLVDPESFAGGTDVLSFSTEDRNIVCSLTSARGEHVKLAYEQNNYDDSANNKLAVVPVAHCELARYPKPAAADATNDCAGTGLGYLGGVALLTPTAATYGECRSGVTQMEATYGPGGSKAGPLTQLPVLAEGANLERNGLRCSAYNGGVACGNVSAGVGFFIAADRYELIQAPAPNPSATPSKP